MAVTGGVLAGRIGGSSILPPSTTYKGVKFNGTNVSINSTSALNVPGNVNHFTLSAWLRAANTGNQQQVLYITDASGNVRVNAKVLANGVYQVEAFTSAGATVFSGSFSTPVSGVWAHFIVNYRDDSVSADRIQAYANGVSDETGFSVVSTNQIYIDRYANLGVTYDPLLVSNSNRYAGSMAEIYLQTANNIDLTVPATLAKFLNGTAPAALGTNGTTPTGSRPDLYFSRGSSDAESVFGSNRGNMGSFAATGTLTDTGVGIVIGA